MALDAYILCALIDFLHINLPRSCESLVLKKTLVVSCSFLIVRQVGKFSHKLCLMCFFIVHFER